jgi:hypothetical protein
VTTNLEASAEADDSATLDLVERHAAAWRRARDWHGEGHVDDWRHGRHDGRAELLGALSIESDGHDDLDGHE